jgi:addiction module RelE/StbE family toxin
MRIKYTQNFLKNYKKRIANNKTLDKQFQERLKLFLLNQRNPLLKTHKLIGAKKNLSAFSVTGDVRVVYYQHGEIIFLIDIGIHNQVY